MPTLPYSTLELEESEFLMELASYISEDDMDDEELVDWLLDDSVAPFMRIRHQEIGPERLSMARLQRENAAAGLDEFDVSSNIYTEFGFTLAELPDVIQALAPPPGFRTVGGHVFSGEEGVLLLLRRFRSTDPLMNLTKSCGRSISAISEAVQYMVEHIVTTFPHLVDERSFSSWAPHFANFAAAFRAKGLPIDSLVGFIDGKLWPVCRPGRYQRVLYSGHKRIHGLKTQGLVFPNGVCAARRAAQHAVQLRGLSKHFSAI